MTLTLSLAIIITLNWVNASSAADINFNENALEYNELKSRLAKIIAAGKGTYGLYLIDLKSGKTLGINALEPFHAASTFKLPLNIYLYSKISGGQVDPGTMLVYRQEHYEGGTGRLQFQRVGSSYSIDTLSKYSIVYSDNVATNMLLSYLGKQNVKNYMRQLGGVVVEDGKNVTCPRDMALYMTVLVDLARQNADYNQLVYYLENTIYNDRIPKMLPQNIKIAHKIGNWPPTGTYNDVGYVQHPKNPYVIAIYSKNTGSSAGAFNVIQRISRAVYDYQSKVVLLNLYFNGQPIKISAPPVLENNTVLVSLRDVAQALDTEVHWDGGTKTIILSKQGMEIVLKIGDNNVTVNGENTPAAGPAKIINSKTMVPLRMISETMGASVVWDSRTNTVNILYEEKNSASSPS